MQIVDTSLDAYLAWLPDEHRDSLTSVDRTIHRTLPNYPFLAPLSETSVRTHSANPLLMATVCHRNQKVCKGPQSPTRS